MLCLVLGGFLLHGCVLFLSSPLTLAGLTAFSAIDCFKTTDKKKPNKPNQNPIASPAFFWISRFEYCKIHTQEEEEGVKAVGGGGLCEVGVISVAGALGTPPGLCSPPLPVLPWFQGHGGHSLAPSGAGLGVELFSSAFYSSVCAASAEKAVKFFAVY